LPYRCVNATAQDAANDHRAFGRLELDRSSGALIPRRLPRSIASGGGHEMKFEEAARRVHLGRSILFTGAGFSFGAKSISGKALMDANGLAAELSARVSEPPLPLDVATDAFLEKFEPKELVHEIQSLFTVCEYQDYHRHISQMPWRRIYTTNYDNLIETCLRAEGVNPRSVTLSDSPGKSLDQGIIIHLNGFSERLNSSYWDPDVVLTTTDYLTDKIRTSDWAEVFRSDLSMADSIIFLGYSLYDLDVARILFENPDIVQKTFFVVGETADRATVRKTGRLGTTLTRNVQDIAPLFPEAGSVDAPVASPFPVNLVRAEFTPSASAPNADEVIAFLTKGDLDENLLAKSVLAGKSDYYIPRVEIERIITSVVDGHRRVLIHSDLGNGKSLACLELSISLSVAGYVIYNFSGSTEGIERDFDYLQSLTVEDRSKSVVIIEDALSFADVVKILTVSYPEIVVIATARSSAVETRLQSISETLSDDYIQFELNELEDDEVKELDALLLSHGLWGEKQGWKADRRTGYIERNCNRHLGSVLLSICKSELVVGRLRDLLKQISNYKDPTYASLVVVLLMAYAGKGVSVSQVCEIVQADLFKTSKTQSNELIKEFVHFNNNRVSVKSPIFSQAVLSELIPDHVIVEMIPDIILRLEQLAGHSDFYRPIVRRLMRFGSVERILSNQNKEEKLVSFYENLRSTGVVNQNPQFWLQYAIARMSFKDYSGADRNFDAAFGLVKGRSYDPYQIENQYARFLLESRTETSLWNDYFDAFDRANFIIKTQMRRVDDGDYPYNVATKYLAFIEVRHSEFDQDQLSRISEWCDELLKIADKAPESIKRRGYWRNFRTSMNSTKDYISDIR